MGQEQEAERRKRAKRIASVAASDPESALANLSALPPLLVADDVGTRLKAAQALVHLSRAAPLELRSTTEALLARLDDTDAVVRTNVLETVTNLAVWYPQEFGAGTDLMVASLSADYREERLAATEALAQIGYYRPDLVTPREDALARLREIREANDLADTDAFEVDESLLDGAIRALTGGDMASRPLEDDLVPSGKRAPLSKPARVAVTALLWLPLTLASLVFLTYHVAKISARANRLSLADVMRIVVFRVSKVTFLYPPARGRLYLRRSWVATPTRVVPSFAGTTPTKADPTADAPPYPDDWNQLATLVYQRDGFECRNCGALGGPRGGTELHVDHQRPRSRGGPDHPKNLRTLCRNCHEARHGRRFDR